MRRVSKILVLILVSVLLLSGCSTTPPDQIVTKFFDALKSLNVEEMTTYVVEGSTEFTSELQPEDQVGVDMLKTVFGKMTYTIGKVTVNGDTASVPVSVTCVDMANVFGDALSKAFGMAFATAFSEETSEDDIQVMFEEMLINALKDPDAPMTTQDVTLTMQKVQGKWLIAFDDQSSKDFTNAITGGLGSLAEAFGEIEE